MYAVMHFLFQKFFKSFGKVGGIIKWWVINIFDEILTNSVVFLILTANYVKFLNFASFIKKKVILSFTSKQNFIS